MHLCWMRSGLVLLPAAILLMSVSGWPQDSAWPVPIVPEPTRWFPARTSSPLSAIATLRQDPRLVLGLGEQGCVAMV